jgi:hypothetical protein
LISNIGGTINVSNLIPRAYEARLDLDEGDEEWIVAIWNRGATPLRRPWQLETMLRTARRIRALRGLGIFR